MEVLPELDLTESLSFQELVDIYPLEKEDITSLPICHTTNWGSYNKIGSQKKIACKICKEYDNEKLIYFFYGKASYAEKENNVPIITNEDPITLIYDLKDINTALHRILPFDSGGFDKYKFKKDFSKEDFTYENPEKSILPKLVGIFHDSNLGYLKKKLSSHIHQELKEICRPFKELIGLYESSGFGKKEYGDQAFTFEIQFKDKDIPYLPKIVILPFTYYNETSWPKMIAAFNKKGISLEYYNDNESVSTGTDSYSNMKSKVINVLDKYYQS